MSLILTVFGILVLGGLFAEMVEAIDSFVNRKEYAKLDKEWDELDTSVSMYDDEDE